MAQGVKCAGMTCSQSHYINPLITLQLSFVELVVGRRCKWVTWLSVHLELDY